MLIGQNAGQDFFPKEIATFTCGLKVSIHRTKVHDKNQYLGFSGQFPAQFSTMYTTDEHPRALIVQDSPQRFKHGFSGRCLCRGTEVTLVTQDQHNPMRNCARKPIKK